MVAHRRLLHKIKNDGINGSTFNWISNGLTKTEQREMERSGPHQVWGAPSNSARSFTFSYVY